MGRKLETARARATLIFTAGGTQILLPGGGRAACALFKNPEKNEMKKETLALTCSARSPEVPPRNEREREKEDGCRL